MDLTAPTTEKAKGAIKWFGLSNPSSVSKEMGTRIPRQFHEDRQSQEPVSQDPLGSLV